MISQLSVTLMCP